MTIASTHSAFAALHSSGTISVWGDPSNGGNTTSMWGFAGGYDAPSGGGFVNIYSTRSAFAALHSSGTISVWGSAGGYGAPSGSGFVTIQSTNAAFAALLSGRRSVSNPDPQRPALEVVALESAFNSFVTHSGVAAAMEAGIMAALASGCRGNSVWWCYDYATCWAGEGLDNTASVFINAALFGNDIRAGFYIQPGTQLFWGTREPWACVPSN